MTDEQVRQIVRQELAKQAASMALAVSQRLIIGSIERRSRTLS